MGASDVSDAVRNYLDNAATSWPKPEAVYGAMDDYARNVGAAAGRGDYRAAITASEIVNQCRRQLMRLVGATTADSIAFFANGTAALNAAILGVVREGDHVVTSTIEHNSVLRPLDELRRQGKIRLDIIPCDGNGNVDISQMLDRIDNETSLVSLAHASNVTGAVQDVAAIGQHLRDSQTLFLCDAAQSLGYLNIDVQTMGINLLAAPGHKGACGPLGTAMLFVDNKALHRIRPTLFGGTGSISESLQMPTQMPEMLEPGNLNVPAIAGWNAGLAWLLSQDKVAQQRSSKTLCERFRQRFADFDHGIAIIGESLPIVSVVIRGGELGVIGSLLAGEYGIDVRHGLHCAALIHDSLRVAHPSDTDKYEGTLRFSAGHFTSPDQIDAAAEAMQDICEVLLTGR